MEIILVAEIHPHRAEFKPRPWQLCPKLQRDPLVGLDLQDQYVGVQDVDRGIAEQRKRRVFEFYRYLGRAPRHPFAGPQIKRHPGPTPIIDFELQTSKSLGHAARVDTGLLAI